MLINDYFMEQDKKNFIPSILFVDDEKNVLSSLRRLFISENYKLFFANNAEEGIKIINENPVHLVITDFRMPNTNGVDFLKKVREICPYTVRMILSGFADIRSIVEAVNEGGIYRFIPKPWDNEDLKLTISNGVEHYSLFEKNRELAQIVKEQNRELRRLNEELEENVISRTEDLMSQNKILSLSQQAISYLPLPLIAFDGKGIVTIENNLSLNLTGGSLLNAKDSDFLAEEILEIIKRVKDGDEKQMECEGFFLKNPNSQKFKGKAIATRCSTIDPDDGVILILIPEQE